MRPTPAQEPRIPIIVGGLWPNRKPFARGADWDDIMPNWPSLFGRESNGDDAGDRPEEAIREMLEFYHGLTDDPGAIVLPIDPVDASATYVETCEELGATWLLTTHVDEIYAEDGSERDTAGFSLERAIRDGPPS